MFILQPTQASKLVLECLKEIASKDADLKDRDFCLLSAVEVTKNQAYAVTIADRQTSLFFPVQLAKNNPIYGTKPVVYGITKGLLDKLKLAIKLDKVETKPLNIDSLPFKAQDRRPELEGSVEIVKGKGKVYLFSWKKSIII